MAEGRHVAPHGSALRIGWQALIILAPVAAELSTFGKSAVSPPSRISLRSDSARRSAAVEVSTLVTKTLERSTVR